ncbi:hypothetical protein C8R43DRAFT_951619 [Mycena crocata]|nr:hypothetical protein C8R43DRAFT_951619 [Mycena crocata]
MPLLTLEEAFRSPQHIGTRPGNPLIPDQTLSAFFRYPHHRVPAPANNSFIPAQTLSTMFRSPDHYISRHPAPNDHNLTYSPDYGVIQPVAELRRIHWDLSYPLVIEKQTFGGRNESITDGPATNPPTAALHVDLPELLAVYQDHWGGPIHVLASEGTITVKDLLDAIDKYFQVPLDLRLLSQEQQRLIHEVHARRVARVQHLGEGPDLDGVRRVDVLQPYYFFDGLDESEFEMSATLRLKAGL